MSELIKLFKQEYARTKKSLGQHFLTNAHFIEEIADAAGLAEGDAVLEIGPGAGVLTEALHRRSSNIKAVDLDSTACTFLEAQKDAFFPKATFINSDITEVDAKELFHEKFTVVGNLPYNVSVRILEHVTNWHKQIECMVFMFQKEVAARVSARHGSRDYSSLSVFAAYHYDITKIRDIGGGNFWPNTKVTSTVLKFTPKKTFPLEAPESFFKFVRSAFVGKRKTLRNNLRNFPELPEVLEKLGLPPLVRAEELSLESFLEIYALLGSYL